VHIEEPQSGEFMAHSVRILNGLDMIINLMEHPEALKEALQHLAHQHHEHEGVRKEHFKVRGIIQRVAFRFRNTSRSLLLSTRRDSMGITFESVCLSVCLFVRSLLQRRMIPKCLNLI